MLEPRRPATRMAARFLARQLGEKVGPTVGYRMRLERKLGPDTRIEVLTEGMLVRQLQSDPELTGVGLVIFDEFHEQSLQAELALTLCLDLCRGLRDDLRLLAMSATLDESRVARAMEGEVVRCDGGLHPVTIEHLARPAGDPLAATERLVRRALAEQPGDILVFLPGKGEIARLAERLEASPIDAEIHQLHGEMDARAQAGVLLPPADHLRRVVLATDVAETSLTIEGITTVVDSGLARKPRFDPDSGLGRLVLEPISRASARQRAGRAGRLGPGHCYRAWTGQEHQRRPDQRPAEILQADLAPLALELALWGVGDPDDLTWVHPPPRGAWQQGVALLQRLEALDARGRITAHGREMAALGLHPRLAHMVLRGGSRQAADLAALLSERDPWRARAGEARPVDLSLRLQALEALRRSGPIDPHLDRGLLQRVLKLSERLQRSVNSADQADLSAAGLLSLAYPDRIALRRGDARARYQLASGRGATLPEHDPLAGSKLLAVAALDAGSREGRIWLALPLEEQQLEALHGHRIEEEEALTWDRTQQRVSAKAVRRLDALALSSRPLPRPHGEAATGLLLEAIREQGLGCLEWPDAVEQLLARVRLAARLDRKASWPDLSEQALLDGLEAWLAPWLQGRTSLAEVRSLPWRQVMESLLPWEPRQRLDRLLPAAWPAPGGRPLPIDYRRNPPLLAAPVQRLYGLKETPAVMEGRLPLLLQLLSPAGRPVQQTRNLAHFWVEGWETVRKELRGRYPKHYWPDEPIHAKPVQLKRQL